MGLIQDLQAEAYGYPVVPYLPVGDKETRMRLQAARIEAGLVFLPREGTWLADFEEEVPEQEPGEGPIGLRGLVVAEAVGDERVEELLDHPRATQRWAQPRHGWVSGRDEGEDVRVFAGDGADGVREPLQVGLPAAAGWPLPGGRVGQEVVGWSGGVAVQLGDDLVGDGFEEVFAAVDVAVERHGFDTISVPSRRMVRAARPRWSMKAIALWMIRSRDKAERPGRSAPAATR